MATVADLLDGSQLPRLEARALLAFATGRSREELVAWPERVVERPAAARFLHAVQRRARGEPVAYLLGEREFLGRRFEVGPAVLVPRPETEFLVLRALAVAEAIGAGRLLDLGTGSGCVAISLALERPPARVQATDVSAAALDVARRNAVNLGAEVVFSQGDWFSAVEGRFDLIVANPPYVASGDPHLDALGFEPRLALDAGPDGLACLRAIVASAPSYLTHGGWLLLEHGYDQAAAVRVMFSDAGLIRVETTADDAGIGRVTGGRRSPD